MKQKWVGFNFVDIRTTKWCNFLHSKSHSRKISCDDRKPKISTTALQISTTPSSSYWRPTKQLQNLKHYSPLSNCASSNTLHSIRGNDEGPPQPCLLVFSSMIFCWKNQGAVSIRKTVLPGMAIPMLKIRRPNGRLIFNKEIAIRR